MSVLLTDETKESSVESAALKKRERLGKIFGLYRKYGIVIVFFLIFVTAAVAAYPNFLKPQNLINIVRQNATITIMACGMNILIISGFIDLSGGMVMAMSGCFAVGVMASTQSLPLALAAGICSAVLVNFLSGLLITAFDLPAFIGTLAMMNVSNGIMQVYTGGASIKGAGGMAFIGQGYIGPVPFPVILMLGIVGVTWVILKKTKFGLYVYAIGGNRKAAIASGINVKKMIRLFYLYHGVMVGISAIVLMGRLNAGMPSVGTGYEFDAITAVVVGGTSFTGGIGSVFGTLVGSLIVGMINNVLVLLNVPTQYQLIVKGLLIAGAVILDMKTRANAKGS
jgi:inositol transport system permease protein